MIRTGVAVRAYNIILVGYSRNVSKFKRVRLDLNLDVTTSFFHVQLIIYFKEIGINRMHFEARESIPCRKTAMNFLMRFPRTLVTNSTCLYILSPWWDAFSTVKRNRLFRRRSGAQTALSVRRDPQRVFGCLTTLDFEWRPRILFADRPAPIETELILWIIETPLL